MKNYYKVLGVPQSATDAEIKKAYNLLARQYDPSRNKGDKYAEERFIDISLAYKTLSDAEKRRDYDKILTDILRESEEELKSRKKNSDQPGESSGRKRLLWVLIGVATVVTAVAVLYNRSDRNDGINGAETVTVVDTIPLGGTNVVVDTVAKTMDTTSGNSTAVKKQDVAVKPDTVAAQRKPVVEKQKMADTANAKTKPVKEQPEEEHVYVGANKSYVLDVQGTPTSITRYGERSEEWHYGRSVINFVDNKVVRIRNTDNNLKIK